MTVTPTHPPGRAARHARSLVAGLLAGALASTAAFADDTEIYTGAALGQLGIKPNVLFILDTSGSMDSVDSNETTTRMERLKAAFNNILDETRNINIGIMRFSDPGGPVLFPVTDIDGDADALARAAGHPSPPDVQVRIDYPDDDGTEVRNFPGRGFTDNALSLTFGDSIGTRESRTMLFGPWEDEDDAESYIDTDDGDNDILDYSIGGDHLNLKEDEDERAYIGVRFRGFPKSTRGALVSHAKLTLRGRRSSSSARSSGHVIGAEIAAEIAAWPKRFESLSGSRGNVNRTCSNIDSTTAGPFCRWVQRASTARALWELPPYYYDGDAREYSARALANVIEEAFATPGYHADTVDGETRPLMLLIRHRWGSGNRDIYSQDFNPLEAARLELTYTYGQGADEDRDIGLRFRDVGIPQGSRIAEAYIEFVSSEDGQTATVDAEFTAEDADSGAPFSAKSMASRTWTAPAIPWKLDHTTPWRDEETVRSPNLAPMLQQVIERDGWCGGNDLVVRLRNATLNSGNLRHFHSRDRSQQGAPVLKVYLDKSHTYSPGTGCLRRNVISRVSAPEDDADEAKSAGSMRLGNDDPNIGTSSFTTARYGAVRFDGINAPKGAKVESAKISFRADNSTSNSSEATWRFFSENSADALSFDTATSNITRRTFNSATVTAVVPGKPVSAGDHYEIDGLGPLLEPVFSLDGWRDGNAVSFLFDATSGSFEFRAFEHDDGRYAPVLSAVVRYNVGDLPTGKFILNPVRERVRELVNSLTPLGATPIVDTMYEAYRYYSGREVLWGRTRGQWGRELQSLTRVSHPGSYEGGASRLPPGCSYDNLGAYECAGEEIVDDGGIATYKSPIEHQCQGNFLVVLTDGLANNLNSKSLIESIGGAKRLTGPQCATTMSDGRSLSASNLYPDQRCGYEVADYMFLNDLSPTVPETNSVRTFTIAMAFESQFLKDVAAYGGGYDKDTGKPDFQTGGGQYLTATSAEDLTSVFRNIIRQAIGTKAFAPPALTTSAFNRLFNGNEVYFSVFEPSQRARWPGNVKKYRLCSSSKEPGCGDPADPQAAGAGVGGIVDYSKPPHGIADRVKGGIRKDARSAWAPADDGSEVTSGGVGAVMRGQVGQGATRRAFTWLGGTDRFTGVSAVETRPQDTVGATAGTPMPLVELSARKPHVIDNIPNAKGNSAEAREKSAELLGMSSALRKRLHVRDLINWVKGMDILDLDGDGLRTDGRYAMGAALHGTPIVISYGTEDANNPLQTEISKFIVGTNSGGLHMFNSYSGLEEWVFYPQSTLRRQGKLFEDPLGPVVYGVDGQPSAWTLDRNSNGIIEPDKGDKVRVYTGMRRGGNEYYALDVTPRSTLKDRSTVNGISPRYQWRIEGGSSEFERLGQTWSQAKVARIRWGATEKNVAETRTVLIFGGGYGEGQDKGFGPSGVSGNGPFPDIGNAIYIVDALTGERLHYVSGTKHSLRPSDGTVVPGMQFPIPSDITLYDSDGDGMPDRLYVGDLGGNVWRVDLHPDLRDQRVGLHSVTARLASLSMPKSTNPLNPVSDLPRTEDQRKFFYRPDVVRVRGDRKYSTQANYDLIVIGSGNRANPLNIDNADRLYVLRDYTVGKLEDKAVLGGLGDGIADGYGVSGDDAKTIQGPVGGIAGDLFDNSALIYSGTPATTHGTDIDKFRSRSGYFIDFFSAGEKSLSQPLVINGRIVITTFLPLGGENVGPCVGVEGAGRAYVLHLVDGLLASPMQELGAGIPSSAVPVFHNVTQPRGEDDPEMSVLVGADGVAVGLEGDFDSAPKGFQGGISGRSVGRAIVGSYWYEDLDD